MFIYMNDVCKIDIQFVNKYQIYDKINHFIARRGQMLSSISYFYLEYCSIILSLNHFDHKLFLKRRNIFLNASFNYSSAHTSSPLKAMETSSGCSSVSSKVAL